jgi:uncharacterized damage-inducible protein DinB
MRRHARVSSVALFLVTLALPLCAQPRTGLVGDLAKDLADLETKIVGLAKAMPDAAWAWRPGPGVRSTSEVLMHVAADNYFMPAAMGTPAPAETAIDGKAYKTAAAFEKKTASRDQVLAELNKSFAFLKKSLDAVPDAKVDAPLDVFGEKTTTRAVWIMTVTHLHEHLGQLIAYARSNKITPPWSK